MAFKSWSRPPERHKLFSAKLDVGGGHKVAAEEVDCRCTWRDLRILRLDQLIFTIMRELSSQATNRFSSVFSRKSSAFQLQTSSEACLKFLSKFFQQLSQSLEFFRDKMPTGTAQGRFSHGVAWCSLVSGENCLILSSSLKCSRCGEFQGDSG